MAKPKATTIRISSDHDEELSKIQANTGLSRSTLITLCISAMIDHIRRTGKVPLPKTKRQEREANRG